MEVKKVISAEKEINTKPQNSLGKKVSLRISGEPNNTDLLFWVARVFLRRSSKTITVDLYFAYELHNIQFHLHAIYGIYVIKDDY